MISYKSKIIIYATEKILSPYLEFIVKKIQSETNHLQTQLHQLDKNALTAANYNYLLNSYYSMIETNKLYLQEISLFCRTIQKCNSNNPQHVQVSDDILEELHLHFEYISSLVGK